MVLPPFPFLGLGTQMDICAIDAVTGHAPGIKPADCFTESCHKKKRDMIDCRAFVLLNYHPHIPGTLISFRG